MSGSGDAGHHGHAGAVGVSVKKGLPRLLVGKLEVNDLAGKRRAIHRQDRRQGVGAPDRANARHVRQAGNLRGGDLCARRITREIPAGEPERCRGAGTSRVSGCGDRAWAASCQACKALRFPQKEARWRLSHHSASEAAACAPDGGPGREARRGTGRRVRQIHREPDTAAVAAVIERPVETGQRHPGLAGSWRAQGRARARRADSGRERATDQESG